jgi:tryptophan-rich sensory protein
MIPAKKRLGLFGWILAALAAGWIGSLFMPGAWYESLAKPDWTPPGFIFAPVWTVLYILMGIAAWLVWQRDGFGASRLALSFFIGQLVLNALWSFLFFGAQRPDLAYLEIVVLWVTILITTILFWREKPLAGILLLPYLLWVSFASFLNLAIWQLN